MVLGNACELLVEEELFLRAVEKEEKDFLHENR